MKWVNDKSMNKTPEQLAKEKYDDSWIHSGALRNAFVQGYRTALEDPRLINILETVKEKWGKEYPGSTIGRCGWFAEQLLNELPQPPKQ